MANMMNLGLIISVLLFTLKVTSTRGFSEINSTQQENGNTDCGGVFTGTQFFLLSPKYPENYSSNLNCDFYLRGPKCPTHYKVDFLDFKLEESIGCTKDRLEIGDQDAVCGERHRFNMYFAKNGSLHLRFRTDGESSERGFKILVTRMACEAEVKETEFTTTTENVDASTMQLVPESTTLPFVAYNMPSSVPELPQCCSNTYNSKRFILTSPDFPYSLNKRTKCIIQIQKANDNVCRIRLNFLFFWLGTTNYNSCPYGSLKIDGKYVCGCNKELKLTTTFNSSNLKTLIFESGGYNLNSPSGFVLEVTQDECPKKYYPQSPNNESKNSQLFGSENEKTGLPWSRQEASIEQLQLVNEITNIVDDTSNHYRKYPRIIKSVYYFATPDYSPIPASTQDVERTTFIDTESINSIVTNFDQFQCNNWNQIQFNLLNARYGRNLQTCKRSEEKKNHRNGDRADSRNNCVELDYLAGYFKSPGYPYYYPGRLNMCYRFKKQAGFCALKVFMVDFKIENSLSCTKDYVLLGNQNRYCGNNLFGQSLTFDLTNKNHEDIRFVTDSFRCGRGFSGVYQQIACHHPSYPINPVNPTTAIIPTIPTQTHPTRSPVCDRFLREKAFTLEVTGNEGSCNFQIQRSSEDVCKISLYFEKFDLVCAAESLSVDGMMFCGHLSGRKVSINVEGNEIKHLIYRSSLRNNYENLKVRIIGEQITDDCLYPEVPPERLVKLEPTLFRNDLLGTDTKKHEHGSKYFIAMHNKQLKEICGVITKSDVLPENFCEILKELHNATRCTILDTNYSYVPYQNNKLNLMNDETVLEVEYEETDCDSSVL